MVKMSAIVRIVIIVTSSVIQLSSTWRRWSTLAPDGTNDAKGHLYSVIHTDSPSPHMTLRLVRCWGQFQWAPGGTGPTWLRAQRSRGDVLLTVWLGKGRVAKSQAVLPLEICWNNTASMQIQGVKM